MSYKVTNKTRKNKPYFMQTRTLTNRLIQGERTIMLCRMCGDAEGEKETVAKCKKDEAKMKRLIAQIGRTIETIQNPMLRKIMEAYFVHGYSQRKIARGIGVCKSTVGNYINKGIDMAKMPKRPIQI